MIVVYLEKLFKSNFLVKKDRMKYGVLHFQILSNVVEMQEKMNQKIEAYSERCQTSKMARFVKIVKG